MSGKKKIYFFATKGYGSNDSLRLRGLLSKFESAVEIPFDHSRKIASSFLLLKKIKREVPDLLVMEGTGILGGLCCLLGKIIFGIPYVFSSGDAIAPYIRSQVFGLSPFFLLYEWLLCRCCMGFIGWTPYLVGRALTFGAPRGVTAEGWNHGGPVRAGSFRARVRERLAIPSDAIVVGIVGNLQWSRVKKFCYGLDLVRAARDLVRKDLHFLIVGGGSGLARLREIAGPQLGINIHLPGQVNLESVPEYLDAMDIASLPQSLDGVGMFRYTTKLAEYASFGLPVISNRTPASYDLAEEWIWTLPGSPWDSDYLKSLDHLLEGINKKGIELKSSSIGFDGRLFNKEFQVARVSRFLTDLLSEK